MLCVCIAVKEMESKVEDTAAFSALPQEEQQELEQTLSQNSELSGLGYCPHTHLTGCAHGMLAQLSAFHCLAIQLLHRLHALSEKMDRRFSTALGQ